MTEHDLGRRSLSDLTEGQRRRAMMRLEVLRPHLYDGVPVPRTAAAAKVSLRTAERWLSAYRDRGIAGLAREPRADRGERRLPPGLVSVIEELYLRRPAPSVATVHRTAGEIATAQGWPLPSYTTVRNIVRALDVALLTLAHEGTKAYQQAYDLIYRREAAAPNDMWQADHTELDLLVIGPTGAPARPWLTAIIDDHSRAVPGYALNLSAPSSLQTALALRQAIWPKTDPAWHVCGIPAILYSDHGSDFTSRHLDQVCADLHAQLIHSTPGMPRGRGKIERFFESVNKLFLPGLAGHLVRGKAASAPKLTLAELDAAMHTFIVNDYHQHRHSETRQPPQQRWDAAGFLPHLPERLEDLDLLLLTVARSRVVQRDGIRVQGMRYFDVNLAAFVGEPVTIRYDPRDLAEIRVFHNGAFLCTAVCQELASVTISLKDLEAARTKRRRELRGEIAERRSLVEELLAVHQTTAPPPTGPRRRLKRYRDD